MFDVNPQAAGLAPDRLARLDRVMQGYVDRDELAGMSLILGRGGHIAYYAKFGWQDREARRPVADDTLYTIMSMTKPITAVAAMLLYEEGHFQLNTPIAQFLPAFQETPVFVRETPAGPELAELERPLTFRHLFTHTAGLSYGWNPADPVDRLYQARGAHEYKVISNARLCELLAQLPLAFQPGTRWRYSLSLNVLGHLVEVISGRPLDAFLRERLFEPLGMVDTDFFIPPEKDHRRAVIYGHPDPARGLQRLDDLQPPSRRPAALSGGGGLISTIGDYARFAHMLAHGGERHGVRILGPETVKLFSLNLAPAGVLPYGFVENDAYHAGYGYSLGTRVLMDVAANGQAGSVGEFGWDGAYSTYFWIDPAQSLYGVLLYQHAPNNFYPVASQFKALAYQALLARP